MTQVLFTVYSIQITLIHLLSFIGILISLCIGFVIPFVRIKHDASKKIEKVLLNDVLNMYIKNVENPLKTQLIFLDNEEIPLVKKHNIINKLEPFRGYLNVNSLKILYFWIDVLNEISISGLDVVKFIHMQDSEKVIKLFLAIDSICELKDIIKKHYIIPNKYIAKTKAYTINKDLLEKNHPPK